MNYRSPYFCMIVVLVMYIIKAGLKLWVGTMIGSISITSDAVHNIADFIEAGFILYVLWTSRRPESEKYPIGRTSIENIGGFLIGLVLLFIGVQFLLKSTLGLLLHFAVLPMLATVIGAVVSAPAPIDFGTHAALAVLVVVISFSLSFFIAWFEISTGKRERHPSLVADGKETLSDAFVEVAILGGVIGSLMGMGYLDFVFGVIVSLVMLHTAYEIVGDSLGNMLQRSIDQEQVVAIERALERTKGVEGYEDNGKRRIVAFKVGKFVIVSARVYVQPSLSSEGAYLLKKGLQQRINDLLPEYDVKIYLRTNVRPETARRAIVPVRLNPDAPLEAYIVDDFLSARAYYIVDLKGDRIVNVYEDRRAFKDIDEFSAYAKKKHIDTAYYVAGDTRLRSAATGVRFERTHFIVFRDLFH